MDKFLRQWRSYFIYGGFFSFFVSILQLTFAVYMLLIFDRVLTSYSVHTLVVITIMAAVALCVMVMLDVVRNRLLVRLGIQMEEDMASTVFERTVKESSQIRQGPPTAAMRDVAALRNFASGSAIIAFFDFPLTPICIILIFILHPFLGYIALVGGILCFSLGILADRVSRRALDQANEVNSGSQHLISQSLRNAEAVTSMGMLQGVQNLWEKKNTVVMNLQSMASQKAGILQASIKGLRLFLQVAIYGTGAYLAVQGQASPGIMIAAAITMGKALAPIDAGIATLKHSIEALAAYKRLNTLFSTPAGPERLDLPAPSGAIKCESVSFAAHNQLLIKGVTFQLDAGESMGLVGPSAAGKSTLCRLLTGIWPATAGHVRLDGADIQSWDQQKLGGHLGYLPQDVELFSGSVAANIARMGELDSEKIIEAAKLAGAHEMILKLPKGYDTEVGAGGAVLSAGQRQRVGLARALYGMPRIVILDEPSSNMDEEGEKALIHCLARLKEMKITVIIVSHKPSTLANVEKILVLKEGQVAMFGPRQQVFGALMASEGAKPVARPAAVKGSPA